jgi:hypothetical protein
MAGRSKAQGRFGEGTNEKVHSQKPTKTLIYSIGNAQSMNLSIQILTLEEKTVHKVKALINSGASGTFIHERVIKKFGIKTKSLGKRTFNLINADGMTHDRKVTKKVYLTYYIKC